MRGRNWAAALTGCACCAAYAQSGPAPLNFLEVTSTTGISYIGPSYFVAWGDANNDALPDLYFGNHGGRPDLFLNSGTGRFASIDSLRFERQASDSHGAAWSDFDNDGDQDLVELVGAQRGTGTKANHLYVNQAGVFRDLAIERGVDDLYGRGRVPLWFDWDGDGRLDLLVLNEDRVEGPSDLYRNTGGHFERTGALGVLEHPKYPLLGTLAAGQTNVLVAGEVFPTRVFDSRQTSPLPLQDLRFGLGLSPAHWVSDAGLADLNGDGIDDIFQARSAFASDAAIFNGRIIARLELPLDGGSLGFNFAASGAVEFRVTPRNELWWNPMVIYLGSGGIHPATVPFQLSSSNTLVQGLAATRGDRGLYVGYDSVADRWRVRLAGTGWQEAIVEVISASLRNLETIGFKPMQPAATPVVLLSSPTGFHDASSVLGLSDPSLASNCSSVAVADFDNDTDVDAVMTCSGSLPFRNVPNQVFRNGGSGAFTRVPGAGGLRRPESGIADGVVAADFDLDGFLDLVITNGRGVPLPLQNGPTQVFRNASWQAGNRNHWLQVDLRGVASNRDGVGAQLVLRAGGKVQRRMQRNGVHGHGQDFQRIHFGLGSATSVQSLEVWWPSGTHHVLSNLPIDQVVRIVEGQPWSRPFELKPSAQAFGSVPVSSSKALTFTLANRTTAPLPINKVQSVGLQAGQFVASHKCGSSLAAGASCSIVVRFKPTGTGNRSARLMVVAGELSVQLANLRGAGT